MGKVFIEFERDCLVAILNSYHETELAEKAKAIPDADLKKIGSLAAFHIGRFSLIDKMIAYGAVKFFEGHTRELNRKKRDMTQFPKHEEEEFTDNESEEILRNLKFNK